MKKLQLIRIFIFIVAFLYCCCGVSYAQFNSSEQEHVLKFANGKVAVATNNDLLNLGNEFTMEAWIYPLFRQDGFIMEKKLNSDPDISYVILLTELGTKIEFVITSKHIKIP